MADIATGSMVGTVQGVQVDFRHPDLPVGEFETFAFFHVYGHTELIFPREAAYIDAHPEDKDKPIRADAIRLKPGDRVEVARVQALSEVRRFWHRHDLEVRHAYLRVVRSEDHVDVPTPLPFRGKANVRGAALRSIFDRLVSRLCFTLGLDDLADRNPSHSDARRTLEKAGVPYGNWPWAAQKEVGYWEMSDADRALYDCRNASEAYWRAMKNLDIADGSKITSKEYLLREVINHASAFGYWLAKAELEEAVALGDKNKSRMDAQRDSISKEFLRRNDPLIRRAREIVEARNFIINRHQCAKALVGLTWTDPELAQFQGKGDKEMSEILSNPAIVPPLFVKRDGEWRAVRPPSGAA